MTVMFPIIIVLAVGIGFLVFFIVKTLTVPKRVSALAGLIKRGKPQLAIKAAKAIIAGDQKNAGAHYYLGMAYLAENKTELALIELKTVSRLGISTGDIPEEEFRQNLAQLFIRHKQGEEALKEYLLLIKLNPNKGDYYYWAGKLFTERNRTDMAENYLKKAAELNPRDGKIHYELGVMLYKDKKGKEAKAELEAALKFQNDNAQIYFYLGKLQKDAKDYITAAASFEKAARDAQFKIKALVERGGCYMSLNAPEKAIPDLERAVKAITDEANPESLYARYFLGMCYEKTRDLDKAIAQWDKIYAQKKNFQDVGEKLAQYQELRSDDNMKDYLTAGQGDFQELCKALIVQAMELQIKSAKNIPDGCEILAIENDSVKWRNVRKAPKLIRFYRLPELLDEAKIRSVLDDAKSQNINQGIVVSGSGFSATAQEYAGSRSVELYNKERLQELLQRVTLSKTPKRP
jgi:tetratricopeptide (TPR) repeat protein